MSKTPRILTLGGDHTTTLSALRSTYQHWGDVSVIHFDSHIGKYFWEESAGTHVLIIPYRYLGPSRHWRWPIGLRVRHKAIIISNHARKELTS